MKVCVKLLTKYGIPSEFLLARLRDYPDENVRQVVEKYVSRIVLNKEGTGLLLFGPGNSGKTMLGSIIAKAFVREGRDVYFASFRTVVDRLMSGTDDHRYFSAGLLVLDNLEWTQVKAFHRDFLHGIIRERHHINLPTVLLSRVDVDEMCSVWGEALRDLVRRKMIVIGCPHDAEFAEKCFAHKHDLVS